MSRGTLSTIGFKYIIYIIIYIYYKNKGDLIIEYVGTLERLNNCLMLLKEKLKFGDRGIYYAKIPNTSYCIDAEIYGNDSRSINHSCNPNSMLKQWVVSFYCNFRCMYIFYI